MNIYAYHCSKFDFVWYCGDCDNQYQQYGTVRIQGGKFPKIKTKKSLYLILFKLYCKFYA